jgi:hypothetical protein
MKFAIELRAIPGPVPPEIRLRRFLKMALRGYGLRCTGCREVAAEQNESDGQGEKPRETAT